jgi:hypothetical protein
MRVLQKFSDPYPHLLVDSLLNADTAVEFLSWLRAPDRNWTLTEKMFYDNWELSLLPRTDPIVAKLFPPPLVASLVETMEQQFGVSLDSRVRIHATRLAPKQSIGVHSDYYRIDPDFRDSTGMPHESHRLLIGLMREYNDENGVWPR